MSAFDDFSLIFRLAADDDASPVVEKAVNKIKGDVSGLSRSASGELDKLTGSVGGLGGSFAGLANPAALAASVITGVATAAVSGATALFQIAESASEFGSQINDASEKSGLGAKSLSALKYAADLSGASFEQITKGVRQFTLTITEAARGNEKATDSLKRFGLEPKEALKDLDASLATVIKKIYDAKPGFEQNALAADAFGKKLGSELIPTINTTGGDFAKFTKEAEKLGVVLSDADAKAADEFGDTLDTLKAQAQGVAFQFAKQFMPEITSAMKAVSQTFADNRNTVISWGNAVKGLISSFADLIAYFNEHSTQFRFLAGLATLGGSEALLASYRQFEAVGATTPQASGSFEPKKPKVEADDSDIVLRPLDGKKKKEIQDSFQKQFKEIADEYGFTVSRTVGGAINKGSLHPLGKAGDLSVRGKTDAQSFEVIAALLEKGFRVIDERVVGAFKGIKSTGPNIHAEQGAGVKESLFLDASRYGGQAELDYLKKLDEDRRNKKTSTDDVAEFIKKRADEEEKARSERVKAIEEENDRILAIEKASNQTRLAILESLVSNKIITEKEYAEESGAIQLDQLESEKALNDELLKNTELSAEERAEIIQKNALLDEEISQQKIKNADAVSDSVRKQTETYKEQSAELEEQLKIVQDAERESVVREAERLKDQELQKGGNRLEILTNYKAFELANIESIHQERIQAIENEEKRLQEKAEKELKNAEDKQKILEQIEKLSNARRLSEEEEFQRQKDEIEERHRLDIQQAQIDQSGGGFLGGILQGVGIGAEELNKKIEPLKTIGNIIGGQFNQIASAVGNAVSAFVLYGKAGASVRQVTAQIIAAVAQQAAVQAVYELAQGFAVLALSFFGVPNAGPSATAHFAAAAIYGSIAGVAAIAGRAIAGDSFNKNQSSASNGFAQSATGKNSANSGNQSSQNQSGNGHGGEAYSSYSDTNIREEDRLRTIGTQKPTEIHEYKIDLTQANGTRKEFVIQTVKENFRNRGDIHQMIQAFVET